MTDHVSDDDRTRETTPPESAQDDSTGQTRLDVPLDAKATAPQQAPSPPEEPSAAEEPSTSEETSSDEEPSAPEAGPAPTESAKATAPQEVPSPPEQPSSSAGPSADEGSVQDGSVDRTRLDVPLDAKATAPQQAPSPPEEPSTSEPEPPVPSSAKATAPQEVPPEPPAPAHAIWYSDYQQPPAPQQPVREAAQETAPHPAPAPQQPVPQPSVPQQRSEDDQKTAPQQQPVPQPSVPQQRSEDDQKTAPRAAPVPHQRPEAEQKTAPQPVPQPRPDSDQRTAPQPLPASQPWVPPQSLPELPGGRSRQASFHRFHFPIGIFLVAFGGSTLLLSVLGWSAHLKEMALYVGEGLASPVLVAAKSVQGLLVLLTLVGLVRRRDVWFLVSLSGWLLGFAAFCVLDVVKSRFADLTEHGGYAVVFAALLFLSYALGVKARVAARQEGPEEPGQDRPSGKGSGQLTRTQEIALAALNRWQRQQPVPQQQPFPQQPPAAGRQFGSPPQPYGTVPQGPLPPGQQ